jgi:hypothetical protein
LESDGETTFAEEDSEEDLEWESGSEEQDQEESFVHIDDILTPNGHSKAKTAEKMPEEPFPQVTRSDQAVRVPKK